MAQVFRINFRYRQTVPAKMPGKLEEGNVFFAHAIQNPNRAEFFAGKPDDLTSRSAEFALQGLRPLDRRVEMVLKELFENVHEKDSRRFRFDKSPKPTLF